MKYIGIIISLVAGIILGYFIFDKKPEIKKIISQTDSSSSEIREGDGVLTNPLLECMGVDTTESVTQLNISRFELREYVDNLIRLKKADFISVYIRDLNNGPWIGINEKEEFIGASLLKLPVLIAYMKLAENDHSILDQKIKYSSVADNSTQYFKPKEEIEVGKTYTVDELLKRTVYYSDNNAAILLATRLTDEEIKKTFASVGLGTPVFQSDFPVNTKTYAGFFRVLFNASYISREYSENTLKILTQTDFDVGLTKFIPKNIAVAHKFGIREEENTRQLHDCGIVYYPNHPYLICVMTRGENFDNLASAIAQISKFTYDQVSKVK